ncbi:radical SAM protein [Acidianus sulfidivorans JP7]|uniref:Radical SAM protein n=1 Tax=Acidianus sulfidivorans JP7 TaxID=619593 RepID=A0A2U9ILS0_9CREN|nr:radical SAM protein [Acidianus sulfidivorans]AWR96950.1 radical SAM protein [Acidianus sulfidivorans JP7]
MFKYVFGPVPSRRFGRSLGVNVVPLKFCNWNCVYCQLGRTNHFINTEENFQDYKEIEKEIEIATKMFEYDYLTFIGDGEPTLYKDLDKLIQFSRQIQSRKIAVFTNGARLKFQHVRDYLKLADVVKVSVDAGDERTFRIIDRPYRDIKFNDLIEGIKEFRHEYSGEIWAEVMLVKNINDNENELHNIGKALSIISPDKIHIMVPTRPPAEQWALSPSSENILKAAKIFSNYIDKNKIYIIDYIERGEFYVDKESPKEGILNILKIQPMTEEEVIKLCKIYNVSINDIKTTVKEVFFNGIKYFVY